MAIKFTENFYAYGLVGDNLATANANFNTQWIVGGTQPSIISAGFVADAKTLLLSRAPSGTSTAERRFETSEDTIIMAYSFKATNRGTTFKIMDGATEILKLEWPNQFKIGATTGTATILLNKVYYVEIKIVKSTKAVTLKVNGFPYLTTTVTATIPNTVQCIWGFDAVGTAASMNFSDVVFTDSSAGKYTDFVGPQAITSRPVDASVDPGWDPTPGTRTRTQIMQNMPPLTTEYTESGTIGQKDFYTSAKVVDPAATVTAVSVTALIAKTDIDTQKIALAVSTGSADKLGTDIDVLVQPTFVQSVFETDTGGTAWTPTTAQATQFGPVVRPRA